MSEDLLNIAQDNDDLNIDLEIEDSDLVFYDVTEQEGFTYPAMLISGIKFNDVLRVLQSVRKESYRLFDVWLDLGDGSPPVKQGTLPADSDTFLAMRYLGLNVTLYLEKDAVRVMHLESISELEDFI